jgi:hypothetical protein
MPKEWTHLELRVPEAHMSRTPAAHGRVLAHIANALRLKPGGILLAANYIEGDTEVIEYVLYVEQRPTRIALERWALEALGMVSTPPKKRTK